MNQNQIKAIQSRLKSRNQKFTLEQLRTYIFTHYHDEELTEDQMSVIVEKLSASSEMVPTGAGELSHAQKKTLIQQVASTLDVSLPIEQIKSISQKMDWAISDRAELKTRIQSAIIAWVDHQIEQDKRQTDDIMQQVETHLIAGLEESNEHFSGKTRAFSRRVEEARDKFRDSEAEILSLFKVPS
ncbi:MAG: hypothetical protein V7L31_24335 [Nostoc sp.]|uniref:hypothetical protein n=1 Tax=Nostoc sp. TaxID=1180 RepID=UPI002FEE9349